MTTTLTTTDNFYFVLTADNKDAFMPVVVYV